MTTRRLIVSRRKGSGQTRRRTSMESSHVAALQSKKATLERQIEAEMARPVPDDVTLKNLKLRKLRIKEELLQLH